MTTKGKRAPGMVDVLAGRWLRAWRMSAGLSGEAFAERAGMSFQQIQKYESGINRISASRLAQFAEIVERAPGDFFIGAEVLQSASLRLGDGFVVDAETCDLLIAYYRTGSDDARERIAAIVRSAGKGRVEDRGRVVFVVRRLSQLRKAA